jgi:hypothetical protein
VTSANDKAGTSAGHGGREVGHNSSHILPASITVTTEASSKPTASNNDCTPTCEKGPLLSSNDAGRIQNSVTISVITTTDKISSTTTASNACENQQQPEENRQEDIIFTVPQVSSSESLTSRRRLLMVWYEN